MKKAAGFSFDRPKVNINVLKKIVPVIAVFLCCCQCNAEVKGWSIKKSKHFIVYHQEISPVFLDEMVRKAEYYYRNITDYLGFRRFDFWTWEKRCKIYFYAGREEYLKNTRAPVWAKGSVHVIRKEIATYVEKEQFSDYILPHEMGHIIFREFIGFDKKLPLWLDEGVAVLQEKDRKKYLVAAGRLAKEGNYRALDKLSKIRSYEQISPRNFYSQAASIVEFLLDEFGRNKFTNFCRQLRDEEEWEKALLKTYRFKDLKALEDAWAKKAAEL